MRLLKHITFVILLLVVFVPPLYAQGSYLEFERGLRLSDAQKQKIGEIRNRYVPEWRTLQRRAIEKRIELRELLRAPSKNIEKIEVLQRELREIADERRNLYQRYRGEIAQNLNESQREQYNNFCDREQRHMMHPYGPRKYGR